MNIQYNKATLLIIFLLSSHILLAQENSFMVSGQYRLRGELRHGFRTLATDSSKAAFFNSQRARLVFDYKKDKITSKISIQDSRTWGDEEQKKDLGGLQVNELWVQLALSKNYALKMGRQELIYDDQRLLGNLDWGNLTISHDALLLKYENKDKHFQWHIGGAFNQSGEPLFGTKYTLKNYKALGIAWLKKEFKGNHSVSGIAILNALNSTLASSPAVKSSITFGPLYNFQDNNWKFVLGAYYQTGKTENNLDISAVMLNAYAEKSIKKVSLGAGVDYLSGNTDQTKATSSNNFSTLYPTNHKFYGSMDYFLSFPNDTRGRGLVDAYLRMKAKTSNRFSAGVDVHSFSLANKDYSGMNQIKKGLGTELDFLTDYIPFADVNLQVGYSMMLATGNMEAVKGGDSKTYNYWAFVMLKVSPVFFKHVFKN